jgi:hypothetical protein
VAVVIKGTSAAFRACVTCFRSRTIDVSRSLIEAEAFSGRSSFPNFLRQDGNHLRLFKTGIDGPDGENFGRRRRFHSGPLCAFGIHAVPTPCPPPCFAPSITCTTWGRASAVSRATLFKLRHYPKTRTLKNRILQKKDILNYNAEKQKFYSPYQGESVIVKLEILWICCAGKSEAWFTPELARQRQCTSRFFWRSHPSDRGPQ